VKSPLVVRSHLIISIWLIKLVKKAYQSVIINKTISNKNRQPNIHGRARHLLPIISDGSISICHKNIKSREKLSQRSLIKMADPTPTSKESLPTYGDIPP